MDYKLLERQSPGRMAKTNEPTGKNSPHSQRLKRLREVMGFPTDTAWAEYLGIPVQRWSNVANGMPVSRDLSFLLVQKVPGLTLDWIYFGKSDGLPLMLARRLGESSEPGKTKTTPG